MRMLNTVLALLISMTTVAGFADDPPTRDQNRASVSASYSNNTAIYADNADFMVRRALLANRREKWVKVTGETTGADRLKPSEFLLVSENSSHDYESLIVSFALAEDVHKGLEFIGMESGHSVNVSELRFWPKGERVLIDVSWIADGKTNNVRAERLMKDTRTGKTFPEDGFVFVGSLVREFPGKSETKYAADHYEPHSIVSHYNDPETVLDVPRMAQQDHVYSHQIPNPEYLFPTGVLVELTMRPEHTDGTKRIKNLLLTVSPGEGDKLVYALTEMNGGTIRENATLEGILAAFENVITAGNDPFVSISFDDSLSLSAIRGFCDFLSKIESSNGIRIDVPAKGTLYYRAFLPLEHLRRRDRRIAQPWELHMSVISNRVEGTIAYIDEVRKQDDSGWTNVVTEYQANTAAEITEVLSQTNRFGRPLGIPVAYVYAPGTCRYDQLMSSVKHVLASRPTVYVFIEDE